MPDSLENTLYNRNFLKRVILRIDFLAPFLDWAEALPAELSQDLLRQFPIAEPKPGFTQKFEMHLATKELQTARTDFTQWRFFGKNREKQLTLHPEFLAMEVTQYPRYETVRDEFLAICAAFFRAFPPDAPQPSRLGMRYINVFEGLGEDVPLIDWSGFFHPLLLEAFKFPPPEDHAMLSRVFHNIEFTFNEFSLRFQFGMHNPDYPAPLRRKSFVLDYDAYMQGALDKAGIGQLLDRFHAKIQEYFEISIREKTREALNA